jgi:hypothetical protein
MTGVTSDVSLDVSSWPEANTLADADGEFALELPGPGRWAVTAFHPGYIAEGHEVEVGESADYVVLELSRESRLRVWVEGPAGVEPAGALVHEFWIRTNAPRTMFRTTPIDGSGQVTLAAKADDEVWLAASHPTFAISCPVKAVYPASGTLDVVLSLSQGGTLEIQVPRIGGDRPPSFTLLDAASGIAVNDRLPPPRLDIGNETVTVTFSRVPACDLVVDLAGTRRAVSVRALETVRLDLTSAPSVDGGSAGPR